MRILLDTNLWVSALISASMRDRIERIIADDRLEILADPDLLAELKEVCSRPKFAQRLTPDCVTEFCKFCETALQLWKPTAKSMFAAIRTTTTCWQSVWTDKQNSCSPATTIYL
jgi:putative PIN family toxin of toxin-antitoxin system